MSISFAHTLTMTIQLPTLTHARLNLDPVRESVNKATDAMFGYMGVKAGNEHE